MTFFHSPPPAQVVLIRATRYGAESGKNADGSSYWVRHVASRRYYGKRVTITWREGRRVHTCANVAVRDKSGKDVIDFPNRMFDGFFGAHGRRLQPRGGFPVKVRVLGKIRGFRIRQHPRKGRR